MPDKTALILAELTQKWLGLHPEHRDTIRLVGELLIELARSAPTTPSSAQSVAATAGSAPSASPVVHPVHASSATIVAAPPIRPAEIRGPRSVVPLRIGDTIQHVEVRGGDVPLSAIAAAAERPTTSSYESAYTPPELPDLEALAVRCDHAAKAARFAAETPPAQRTALWRTQADEFIQRAVALGATRGPWSLDADQHFSVPNLLRLAKCFENLAHASRVVLLSRKEVEGTRLTEPRSVEEREIVRLLAEAQSSLRIAGEPFGQTRDEDQYTAFRWLRQVTEYERIYLDRFMRMDDPGDPDLADEFAARLRDAEQSLTKRKESRTEHKSRRGKVRYHAKRILSDVGNGEESDWNSLTIAIKQLLDLGESTGAVGSLLTDVRESPKWAGAPAELLEALAPPAEDDEDDSAGTREYGPNVLRVREWLSNSRAVIIGGQRRSVASERIIDAFGLSELEWMALVEHSSSAPLRSEIVRPDTRLVLVLIKLAGHTHVDDARRWSREADKPCVLLRAGYNPEQIAASIIDQVSEEALSGRAAS